MQMSGFTMGLGLGILGRHFASSPGQGPYITAITAPVLSALNDSQTPTDGYVAGAYSSTAGAIASVVETWLVNGTAQVSGYDLSAGDIVQVSVLVGDSAANSRVFTTATVTVSAAGSAGTLAITATRGSDQTAPEGIWFEATPASFDVSLPTGGAVYDPTFHDIHYVWSFDDAGNFNAPVNIPASWNNKDVAYGRQVTHVFEAPGSYNVTCTATDRSGNVATTSYSVTVKDPATEWPGARTIIVSLDGAETWAGEPAGADRHTSMASAEAAYKALGATGRLLLKADGSDYAFSDARIRNSYPNFHLGTWGNGARPTVSHRLWLNDMASTKDSTLWGFDLTRGWDTTTETGSNAGNGLFIDAGRHATFYDVRLDGCIQSIQLTNTVTTGAFIWQEAIISNWQGYGCLMSALGTTKFGMKGCRIAQHVDALGGGKGKGTGHNEHGPFRWSGNLPGATTKGYFGANDFFSNTGWSTAGPNPAHQAPFRVSGGNTGMFINMERLSLEGGENQIGLTDTAGGSEALPTNILVDKFILVGGDNCQHNIKIGLGAVELRNGVIIQANVPTQTTTSWRSTVLFEDAGDDARNLSEEVKLINCSMVNLLDDINDTNISPAFSVNGGGTFATETLDNNILHMPNSASAPETGDAPLQTTPLWAARYKGLRNEDKPVLNTAHAPPAGTVAIYGAVAGSAALGGATSGTWAIDDIYGTLRGTTRSRGALE